MPAGYLITTALMGVFVLLAIAPPPRIGMTAFRVGLPAAELPLVLTAYLLAATLLELVQSGIPGIAAGIGVAVALVEIGALGLVVRRMAGARAEVAAALGRGLGAPPPARRRRGTTAPALLAPLPLGRSGVERIVDIPYGDAGERNLLDLYRPRRRLEGCPALLHLHGGGFVRGRKSREALPLLHRLAHRGWVCASANYRLFPTPYADRLADARNAIAWLAIEGRAYGADPAMLVVAGSSAGAHLVSMAALTAAGSADPGRLPTRGVVCLHGYFGQTQGPGSSPFDHVGGGAPPFFIAHGDLDTVVPVEQARRFADALRTGGSPVVYAELHGAQHGFDRFDSLRHEHLIDGIEAFAAAIR